jgi:hypothetical protein
MSHVSLTPADFGPFLGRPFSSVWIWGFAPVRPGDQLWTLAAVEARGDRLTLRCAHADGSPSEIVVHAPVGLRVGADGLALHDAARVDHPAASMWREEGALILSTARGRFTRPASGHPALTLGRPPEAP